MDYELLIAAGGHGPQRHGPVLAIIAVVILAIAVVAGLVSLVRRAKARKGSDPDAASDRDPGTQ